ncbi:MAG TPA: YhcN/YlaJ family sporulation lipoprotein [Bacillales bacterium]|nr:YhcN/YlaJ family sporulation lipoprotein [Bacillales bacterium]
MKTSKGIAFLLIGTALLTGSGCAGGQGQSGLGNSKPVPVRMQVPVDQTPSRQVENKVIKRKDVTKVIAVNSKKDLMVGLKLKTMARFSTLQIVKGVQKKLQKQYPKVKVQVSSDQKIYSEISDLKMKLSQGKITMGMLDQKMERIDRFMKEQDPSKQ